jgi:hypothetical protein
MKPSRVLPAALVLLAAAPALRAQWTAPTPAELAMTSIPEVPGAPAVYLFKEETADDGAHMQSFYYRIKVLTEGGKDYANVELPYASGESGVTLDSVSARTIHADGTIIPMTAKPYEKVVEKTQDYKIKVKVFTLPSVEVGSILEYRYKLHLDDHYFQHPEWFVQGDLFTRKAHYMWRPTDLPLTTEDGKQTSTAVAWFPILPPGVEVKQTRLLTHSTEGGETQLDLDVHDIAPMPKEQFMPPMKSLSYKVLFYYAAYRTPKEYWAGEGKRWSKQRDKFMSPGPLTTGAVKELTAGATTQDQKLKSLYSAVMAIENTDFTRQHTTSEERAQGLKDVKTVDDLLVRKRASGDQLAELFVAMARAAGMKAYLMAVADRSERFFLPSYLSFDQLDDYIAVVNVDGKDVFFDPGQRYCSYGHLSWRHALTAGLRQTDSGTDIAATPGLSYKETTIKRVADLKLDEQGVATGAVFISYTGDSAMALRQEVLREDETSLNNDLRTRLEQMLPGGMEIKVGKIENIADPDQPLKVNYEVKGPIGSPTGKRLLVPANLFEANSKPKFPEPKRDLPIDMHYPSMTQDAVRLTLPATLVVESAPVKADAQIAGSAAFDASTRTTPNSITMYRNVTIGKTMFGAENYAQLREFYGKIETKDQETLVLTHGDGAAKSEGGVQ